MSRLTAAAAADKEIAEPGCSVPLPIIPDEQGPMYKDYFGFKEAPFSIAPDPQFLYMSERHREALAHLIYGMKADSGFVLLTGEVGTGKTTVCRCLLGQLPENSEIAFILNPKLSVIELLATICDELQIDYPAERATVKTLVDLINLFLLEAHSRGRKTVLIIDEAQNLSTDVLEQIRLLTNLETDKHKLLQVIMLGQPELNRMLELPELRQLAQRVTARYHLEPLGKADLAGYLRHRLAVAGVERPLFPGRTISAIFRLTGGVPRLINLLCDRALLGAYVRGQSEVGPALLKEAAGEIFGRQREPGRLFQWLFVALLSLILIAGIAFMAAYLRLDSTSTAEGPAPPPERRTIGPEPGREVAPLVWDGAEPVARSGPMAYRQLFQLWGVDDFDLDQEARSQAQALGLELMTRRASLGRLKQLNRPAVLKIVAPPGDTFYATLVRLDDFYATLTIGNLTRRVPVARLTQQWFGDYGLIWRPPGGYRGALKPGDESPLVHWLEQQLAPLAGRDAEVSGPMVFDGRLLGEVRAFQQKMGITADGVVGPHTLILLNSKVGEQPTLDD